MTLPIQAEIDKDAGLLQRFYKRNMINYITYTLLGSDESA